MVWDQEIISSDWKKDRLDCSNYRGISLLCHCSKIFSSIILQRIKKRTDAQAQAGFRSTRSTIDQIFTLRQLAEKYQEFGKESLHQFSQGF